MLTPPTLARAGARALFRPTSLRAFTTSAPSRVSENPVPANDPNPKQDPSPISATNAQTQDAAGSFDAGLQESVEAGEKKRQLQAPNRAGVWSRSQKERSAAMVGPRFEQTIIDEQVCLVLFSGAACRAVRRACRLDVRVEERERAIEREKRW